MAPADVVGTVLDGKLRVERLLASGAGGDVYEALHLGLRTRVAVKVLRPGGGEAAAVRKRRFLREARVAARLRSPHVVRVHDIVAGDAEPTYIVMELLEGETLTERLARTGPLPVAEAVNFVRQAAAALGEMHAAGIIHRDVKPSNLFLAKEDGLTRVKLLDFGIAALRQPTEEDGDSSITRSAVFVGTPKYMAPEQALSSKGVDARADVWALGVTIYELLSGVPPFDGQTIVALLHQIEHCVPKPLSDLRPEVPAGLVALVHRCMSRDLDLRPADAAVLGEELAPFDAAPAASPASPRRSPRVAALAMIAAVVIGLLALVGFRRSSDAQPLASGSASPAPQASEPVAAAQTSPPSPLIPEVPVSALPPAAPPPVQASPAPRVRPRPAVTRPTAAARPANKDDDRIE